MGMIAIWPLTYHMFFDCIFYYSGGDTWIKYCDKHEFYCRFHGKNEANTLKRRFLPKITFFDLCVPAKFFFSILFKAVLCDKALKKQYHDTFNLSKSLVFAEKNEIPWKKPIKNGHFDARGTLASLAAPKFFFKFFGFHICNRAWF